MSEARSRDLIVPFLADRNVDVVQDVRRTTGTAVSQTLHARLSNGQAAVLRVKLCWRRDDRNAREMLYSAAQLVARRLEAGWQETLDRFVERNQQQGVTHLLLAQPEATRISLAALIPLEFVGDIWWRQYDVSDELIREGRLGRATTQRMVIARRSGCRTIGSRTGIGWQMSCGATSV